MSVYILGAFDQLKQNATKARIPFYGRFVFNMIKVFNDSLYTLNTTYCMSFTQVMFAYMILIIVYSTQRFKWKCIHGFDLTIILICCIF